MRKKRHEILGLIDREIKANTCFVMMPFRPAWSAGVWRTIYESLGSDGIACHRADNIRGHVVIDDIVRGIATSRLLIADVTGKNANVFYEIGLAHALERQVLFLAQSSNQIVFDVNRFRHIIYQPTPPGLENLGITLRRFAKDRLVPGERRPYTITISRPGPGVPPAHAKFVGQWEGLWTGSTPGSLRHTLIVGKVIGAEAHVYYFHGTSPEWNIFGNSWRAIGTMDNGNLTLSLPDAEIRYWIDGEIMRAERFDPGGRFECTLSRVSED